MAKLTPESPEYKPSVEDLLYQILNALRHGSGRFKESLQEGSPAIPLDSWPAHLAAVQRPDGSHVGFGFFVARHGSVVFVTAAHILKEVSKGGKIASQTKAMLLDPDFKILTSGSLDLMILQVPNNYPALLGVSKLKLALTPNLGLAVSIYGYIHGKMCRTIGVVSGVDKRRMQFKHTASTQLGHCGSPLITDGKVVGIHVESDGLGYNYGLSLDFLVRTKEAFGDSYSDGKYLFTGRDEDDESLYDGDDRDEDLEAEMQDFMDDGTDRMWLKGSGKMLSFEMELAEEVEQKKRDRIAKLADAATWSDESLQLRREYGVKESAPKDFPKAEEALQTPSPATTNGNPAPLKKAKKNNKKASKKAVPSASSEPSPSPQVETPEVKPDLTEPNVDISQDSATTAGPSETPTAPESPSPSTPVGSDKGKGSPRTKKQKKYVKPLSEAENIRALVSQLSSYEERIKESTSTTPIKHLSNSARKTLNQLRSALSATS